MKRTMALCVLSWLCMATVAAADDKTICQDATGEPAIEACTRAIDSRAYSGRDLAALHVNRGVELKRKGALDAALADYDRAIALHPGDLFAYNNRANVRREKGNLEGAIADYTAAIRLDADYAAAYTNRGRIHEMRNEAQRARADYTAALKTSDKYDNSKWAKDFAQRRLQVLGQ
jgi:tetratricopeptide (TPR) repeat protein